MLDRAKTTLRKHAPALAYFLKTMLRGRSGVSRSPEATFSQIYEQGTWGGAAGELDSGSGSQDAVSAPFVALIRRLIAENEIRSVADLGCGDYRVGQQLSDLPIDYTGIDVVPSLIARNNAAFGTSSVRFACKDITRDPLPPADLCIVRQVLQHLSNAQINLVLARLTSYRFVVVAEHHPARLSRPNRDKDTGADTRIDFDSGVYLEYPPFSVANARVIASTPLPALLRDGEHLSIYLITNG
jgi:SAM-dependent methyltransferase